MHFHFYHCKNIRWKVQLMELFIVCSCLSTCQNVKLWPVHTMKAYRGSEVHLHSLLTSVLDGGEWPTLRPGRFTLLKEPRCKLAGGREGPKTGLDDFQKREMSLSLPEFEPQITQPVALITVLTAPSGLPPAASSLMCRWILINYYFFHFSVMCYKTRNKAKGRREWNM